MFGRREIGGDSETPRWPVIILINGKGWPTRDQKSSVLWPSSKGLGPEIPLGATTCSQGVGRRLPRGAPTQARESVQTALNGACLKCNKWSSIIRIRRKSQYQLFSVQIVLINCLIAEHAYFRERAYRCWLGLEVLF